MSTLKVDLYPEEVYTFTPKGRVIILPRDATPIDFAYAIHSDVGNTLRRRQGKRPHCAVEVRATQWRRGGDPDARRTICPSKDWLSLVKTSRARNKIKHVINTTERAKAIEIGEKYLEREARRLGVADEPDHETRQLERSPPTTGTARLRICTPRSATASSRLAKCCRSSRRTWSRPKPAAESRKPRRTRRRRGHRRQRAGPGHQSQRHRRSVGLSRQVLQSDPRRSHRRIRDARKRRGGAFANLYERAEPDVRSGAQDRRRMGAQPPPRRSR